MGSDATVELLALLAEQRACLKAGKLADLSNLSQRIEAAGTALQRRGATRGQLTRLADAARVNMPLIRAAAQGVGAAQARLAAMRGAREALSVYTADGRAVRHGATPPLVERRS
jgi:hypothetical protein